MQRCTTFVHTLASRALGRLALGRLALGTAAITLAPVAASAQTPCPASAAVGKGLSLSSPDGRKSEITWLADNRVKVNEHAPDGVRGFPRETITARGLLGLEVVSPVSKARVTYGTPPDKVFPLDVGQQHILEYQSQVEGGTALKGTMAVAVLEKLEHKIGECAYEALLVARLSQFADGRQTPTRYEVYVPTLQVVVKSTLFDDASQSIIASETFEYETIAAR